MNQRIYILREREEYKQPDKDQKKKHDTTANKKPKSQLEINKKQRFYL